MDDFRASPSTELLAMVRSEYGVVVEWPIPPRRRTLSGAGFVAFGDRVVEVEAYVDAGSPMASWDSLSAGLPWLARLHDALRAAPYAWAEDSNSVRKSAQFVSTSLG